MRSLTFVLASALVIPMGAGFALLTHEDHSTIAADALNLVQDSPAATSSAQSLPANTIAMPTASREDDDDHDNKKSNGKKSKDSDDDDEDDEEDDD